MLTIKERACIYFIYDKQGVVDTYIRKQLEAMRKHVALLVCVVNGKLCGTSKNELSVICDEVLERENKGLDVGAYKDAIYHIGWENLEHYDELILMNFTCFGPVYPLKELFAWSNTQSVDIWGLTWDTEHFYLPNNPHVTNYGRYLQSNFIVLRKSLIKNRLIKKFFEDIPEDMTYSKSGFYFEHAFPGYFLERGFTFAVYCDSTDDYNYPLLHDPVRLLKDYRMPFFKKRSFFHHQADVLYNTSGESTYELLEYLRNNHLYDEDLIWDSVLRSCSLSDVIRCTQLKRIIDDKVATQSQSEMKIAAMFHLWYEDCFEKYLRHMSMMPSGTDLYVTVGNDEARKTVLKIASEMGLNCQVFTIPNRGRDISALLVAMAPFVHKYDLVCFVHDKKSLRVNPASAVRSWSKKLLECMICSPQYIMNIIDLFEKEKRLGIAYPPYPNHSRYGNLDTFWTGNFNLTKKLLDHFGVSAKINKGTLCVAPMGTCFWFRPKALEKLFRGLSGNGWSYSDFPSEPILNDNTLLHVIERAFTYFAQDAGYYPVQLYTKKFASIDLTNLEYLQKGAEHMRKESEELVLSQLRDDSVDQKMKYPANNSIEKHKNVSKKYNIIWFYITYFRYKLLSKITSGKRRRHYLDKRYFFKSKLIEIRLVMSNLSRG